MNDFTDTQVGFYVENKIQWAEKFRSVAALRGDLDYFDVTSLSNPTNSGTADTFLPSPKLSLIFGPWAKTEFYVQGGFSFHSNDGRGATQTMEPVSADNPNPGTPSAKIPALIQTKGAEIGVRTLVVPKLQSTVSLWYLHSDSELMQDGDTGGTVASQQPSNRYGVEWANYYTLTKHLAFDLDAADSIARFTSVDADDAAPGSPGGNHVPEAVGVVISSGITLHDFHGFSSSLRLRYFGPRDLTSDGMYQSSETILLNAEAGYQINKTWRISVEVLNLLDRHDHDIDYAYESRVTPAAAATVSRCLSSRRTLSGAGRLDRAVLEIQPHRLAAASSRCAFLIAPVKNGKPLASGPVPAILQTICDTESAISTAERANESSSRRGFCRWRCGCSWRRRKSARRCTPGCTAERFPTMTTIAPSSPSRMDSLIRPFATFRSSRRRPGLKSRRCSLNFPLSARPLKIFRLAAPRPLPVLPS